MHHAATWQWKTEEEEEGGYMAVEDMAARREEGGYTAIQNIGGYMSHERRRLHFF
jgi:hypothetical protein